MLNSSNMRLTAWFALAVLATYASHDSLHAQTPSKDKPAAPQTPVMPLKAGNVSDPVDLEAFFDGAIPSQMESKHIAGAVVAVVVGDKLIFSKGYGYADVETRRKVDPEKTL